MEYLEYAGLRIDYRIVKSSRKTISIHVKQDGVIVRAPRGISNSTLHNIVKGKSQWIYEKYKELKITTSESSQKKYEEGCEWLYQGIIKKLHFIADTNSNLPDKTDLIELTDDKIVIKSKSLTEEEISNVLEQWYRNAAKIVIKDRVDYYTSEYDFGKKVNRITIKNQKSRWGSCSSKCNLNFSYRLMMAPREVLDYVVVHELCHLLHMNHSREFWETVASILPDYKECREWLKNNGNQIS